MRYISVCAGIEAATVAWHHMGWTPAWFSEIEPFPSAVLAHHYPEVRNLGDMTRYEEWPDEPVDLLVGGTPCQSFSVAGLRKGLSDPRGGLMLTYLEIARRYRPRWVVWENVPGVLSSNRGRDFGAFLGALGELGYGFAYRVLDAQWFGVAQRRRRVFVVGYLGDWRRAAAVLFERESVRRDTPPSREARQTIAPTIAGSSNGGGANGPGRDVDSCNSLQVITLAHGQGGAEIGFDRGPTLTCIHEAPIAAFAKTHKPTSQEDAEGWSPVEAAPTITHWPRDRSDTGTDVAVVGFHNRQDPDVSGDITHPLGAKDNGLAVAQPIPIHDQATRFAGKRGDNYDGKGNGLGIGKEGDPAPTLTKGDKHAVHSEMQVRRLTPVECERLQGFPDNYTNIPWRKKPDAPDGPRYKSLGNSMAVPVMRWIGQRIEEIDKT